MINRYRYEENLPESMSLQWADEKTSIYLIDLVLGVDLDWHSVGNVTVVLDSGEISKDTLEDGKLENDRVDDAFFQQGYFESTFLDSKGIAFRVGQQHLVVCEGYVLDDFLLAGQVGADLNRLLGVPWSLYASLAQIQGSSLYLQLRTVHPFGEYEKFSLSAGWLHDTEGFVGELLEEVFSRDPRSRYVDLSLRSEADLGWIAASLNRNLSSFSLSGTGIVGIGRIELSARSSGPLVSRTSRFSVPALGYLLDLLISRDLTERATLGAFFLMASGDDGPLDALQNEDTLNVFLSITPFITRTNIFFSGGISENLSTRRFNIAGNTARGFLAPGMQASYSFTDDLRVEGKAAYLLSHASPPEAASGRDYGWEIDLMAFWEMGKHVRVSLEADDFHPGGFFEIPALADPDPAYRFVAGLDIRI